jgi:ubiquinone/menaquinone biosynthesis C-methylase UbiE
MPALMARADKDENRAFYDTHREHDRHRFHEGSKAFLAETIVPFVTSALEPGARIVDIGGGSGAYASLIVRAAPVTVVGLDISASMVDQRSEDPMLTENVVGDMEELPFEDASFDGALFVASLHHVPDPGPALREAFRVVRPGGAFFAVEPCSLRIGAAGVGPVAGHAHEFRFSLAFLTGRIRDAGFEIDRIAGKRTLLRFVRPLVRTPSLEAHRRADRVDRALSIVPGYARLAELAMIRGRRPDTRG